MFEIFGHTLKSTEISTVVKLKWVLFFSKDLRIIRISFFFKSPKGCQRFRVVKEPKVVIYYWDDRDGSEFRGWWFGNTLEGAQASWQNGIREFSFEHFCVFESFSIVL